MIRTHDGATTVAPRPQGRSSDRQSAAVAPLARRRSRWGRRRGDQPPKATESRGNASAGSIRHSATWLSQE